MSNQWLLFVLFMALPQIFGSGCQPTVVRGQHEKVPAYKMACTRSNCLLIRESTGCFSRLDSLRRLQIQFLEARVDSLEAMLERAHVVVVIEVYPDTVGGGVHTHYEISFEPKDSTQ